MEIRLFANVINYLHDVILDPKSNMTGVLIRSGKPRDTHRQTQREKGHVMMEAETGVPHASLGRELPRGWCG